MVVCSSSLKNKWEVAGAILPAHMIGVHFVTDKSVNVRLDSSFAEHIATLLDAQNGRYILSDPQQICAFSDIDSRNVKLLEMVVLENQGDLHFFQEHPLGKITKDMLLGTFYEGRSLAEKLKFPVMQANQGAYPLALNYALHNNAIELYFIGGTKDLKVKQVEARHEIESMAQVLYQKVHSNVQIEVKEEKKMFKVSDMGAYISGYLKSVARPVQYDLPLDALG